VFPLIAVIFLLVPIIEIYLLIQVGQVIGAGWTIFLVVLGRAGPFSWWF
jgi:UPF0716 protein FxsA